MMMAKGSVLASMLLVVVACGASLTDAQKLWCGAHDMTPLLSIGSFSDSVDDAVLQAASKLGIAVPDVLKEANSVFAMANLTGQFDGSTPEGWPDAMKTWRTTGDYARACIAAFDSK